LNTERQRTEETQTALSDALGVSFRVLRTTMILLLVLYFFSGVFIVSQHEKAFVLVFGKIAGIGEARVLGPGIHWTFPKPIAEVVHIPAERVRTIQTESFWYEITDGERLHGEQKMAGGTLDPLKDGYSLSGDANILHSRWSLRYTINQPEAFTFKFIAPTDILRNELDHAIVETSANFPVDQALRTDIENFRSEVDRNLRLRCRELGLGVNIQRLDLVRVSPPRQVAAAFDAVVEAEQESSREITDARASATRLLNEGKGDASRIISEGQTYKRQLVTEVNANADYFNAVYEKYLKHPRITSETLLQDTLRRVLAGVEQKYYLYSGKDGNQEVRLLLGQEYENPLEREE